MAKTPDMSDRSTPPTPLTPADTEASSPTAESDQIDGIRNPIFIFSYVANLSLVTANAATFVFADWVAWLATNTSSIGSYREELPGRVIQYGLLAAICGRIFLGQSIDRFGVRRVWVTMSCLGLAGLSLFATIQTVSYLLPFGRILFATGLAGMFTCSTFHIQSCVAEHRRTEFIALLGSSGFVGMTLGAQIADVLRWMTAGRQETFFSAIFSCAVLLLCLYIGCVLFITRNLKRPTAQETRPSLIHLTRQYWPGMITIVSMMMGVIFVVPSLYLIRFNQHESFGGIAAYWTTYAVMAFTFRIRTAALSQKIGRHKLVFVGLMAQGLGLWALVPVTAWWHLLFSAILCGFGHAFLFPSIVSLGSGTFPARYRGSGTNLTLGFLDLGGALSAPLMGRIIDMEQFNGVGFRPMFFCAGALPILVAAVWFFWHRNSSDLEVKKTIL